MAHNITHVNSFFFKKTDHVIEDIMYTVTTVTIVLGTIYSISLFVRNETIKSCLLKYISYICTIIKSNYARYC